MKMCIHIILTCKRKLTENTTTDFLIRMEELIERRHHLENTKLP